MRLKKTMIQTTGVVLAAALGGCGGSFKVSDLVPKGGILAPTYTQSLKLSDLHRELGPYTESSTFDFVTGKFEYGQIQSASMQKSFREAAKIAATFRQTHDALELFERKGRKIESSEELTYYIIMADLAGRLPKMVERAERLQGAIASYDPQGSPIEVTKFAQGSSRALEHLTSVLESDREVDDVLEDYAALKREIEELEAAELG